ncbi:hypothetical protein [Luteimicrobium subarcticum]|uniref:PH domain-containing protein n=1 Tax=Luteimicrobium subarcticum TaxID=620910 RepID=A0A2M8W3V7_9MICO|nr:hypothetical protein [Luteimicrobium subarcticum]PJI85608.1 hypothetical protein CLV34_2791 [Luteimicrobium subarcticum]
MNLPMPVAVGIWIVIGIALFVIMWRGWRHRERRGAALVPDLPPVPATGDLGTTRTGEIAGVYVSSTTAGDWLDRVAAHDLGYRSRAVAQVFDTGVLITREGAHDVFVPADRLVDVTTSPGMAGKFVGKDGLVVVTWEAPGATLDTGLRTQHPGDRAVLVDAVRALRDETASTTEEKQ